MDRERVIILIGMSVQKITPNLWFDSQAEEAAKFYVSLFPNSKITKTTYYPGATEAVSGKPKGSILTVEYELTGQPFLNLNGGPQFSFNESVSFVIDCKDQAEIDHYWDGFIDNGGTESECGWLKDKFGVSWQVVPAILNELLDDPTKAERVTTAFLKMKKFNIAELEAAANR